MTLSKVYLVDFGKLLAHIRRFGNPYIDKDYCCLLGFDNICCVEIGIV